MSIKWCTFTGALMLLFVLLTWVTTAIHDQPGVKTRWWDGTLQTVEQYYSDGKIASRKEYGPDGTTLLKQQEWSHEGVILHQKIRLDDGTVEEKRFAPDGKSVMDYTLWNGDLQSFRISRRFASDGKPVEETINTDDGKITLIRRSFYPPGVLEEEFQILGNADQQTSHYINGKLSRREIFRGNMDQVYVSFDSKGRMWHRQTLVKFNGSVVHEYFDEKEQIVVQRVSRDSDHPDQIVTSSFEAGKLKFSQHADPWGAIFAVDEFSTTTGLVTRHLSISQDGKVMVVQRFRVDGTLEMYQHLTGRGVVDRQIQYDATGKKEEVSKATSGEAEHIDPQLLKPIVLPSPRGDDQ